MGRRTAGKMLKLCTSLAEELPPPDAHDAPRSNGNSNGGGGNKGKKGGKKAAAGAADALNAKLVATAPAGALSQALMTLALVRASKGVECGQC